ncbi:MAG: hypothetical protein COA78_23315 [Blastopirellula sp.]|nr:MAG: hypothetical protein COA78_23315 [Blastopirellula sp.]
MQPDNEDNKLAALLTQQYGAPQLDDQFSENLVKRLQAEAAPLSTRKASTQEQPHNSQRSLYFSAGFVVASLVFGMIWIAFSNTPETKQELAQKLESNLDRMAIWEPDLEKKPTRDLSVGTSSFETLLVESESIPTKEGTVTSFALTDLPEQKVDTKHGSESLQLVSEFNLFQESLVAEEQSLSRKLQKISAITSHAKVLYLVKSGQLYQVNLLDGSQQTIGDDDWTKTTAMAASEFIYIVIENQLYKVNPTTGLRRSLGDPIWNKPAELVIANNELFIINKSRMYRINRNDGSHALVDIKTE